MAWLTKTDVAHLLPQPGRGRLEQLLERELGAAAAVQRALAQHPPAQPADAPGTKAALAQEEGPEGGPRHVLLGALLLSRGGRRGLDSVN